MSTPMTLEERNALVEAEAQRLMAGRCPDDCADCYAAAEATIDRKQAPVTAPEARPERGFDVLCEKCGGLAACWCKTPAPGAQR